MNAKRGWAKWLRGILLVAALFIASITAPYFVARGAIEIARAFDGRSAAAEQALARLAIYPHGGFRALKTEDLEIAIAQRQVLRYPPGILYALRWADAKGRDCIANAFVEKIPDNFAGWKGRGAWSHCSARDYTAWVSGRGEYRGFSVANGLSGNAALVKVAWRTGEVTFALPVNGVYMSVLDRDGARAILVEFLDASGALLHSHKPYG